MTKFGTTYFNIDTFTESHEYPIFLLVPGPTYTNYMGDVQNCLTHHNI